MIRNLLWVRRVFMNYTGEKLVKVACLICGFSLDIKRYKRIEVGKKHFYVICPHCGGGNLIPRLSQKEIKSAYKKEDYYKGLSREFKNPIIQWLVTRRVHETPSEWSARNFKKGKILDVGCGNGDFPKLNFNQKFDYVSFWHVLEHIKNPQEYFDKASMVLSKKGKVIGEVPNFDSLTLKIFTPNYSWLSIPFHVTYLSRESLTWLAKKAGFRKITFYFPPRALLNFALSIDRYLQKRNLPFFARMGVLVLSTPFSALFVSVNALFGRGEVVRFVAEK